MATLTLSPSLATSARAHARRAHATPLSPVARGGAAAVPVRLTRRGRVVVAVAMLLASLLVGVVGSVAWSALASDGAAAGASAGERYVVTAGDTLWSIAAMVAGGGDVRAAMYAIKQANDLTTSAVMPGQVLVLPTR